MKKRRGGEGGGRTGERRKTSRRGDTVSRDGVLELRGRKGGRKD